MFRKILLYGLPVYLYGLELLLKSIANVKADSVAGPTLAGAGIGFLLPLTQLKPVPIDPSLKKALDAIKAEVYSSRDGRFTDLVWLAFFISLLAWMYAIFLTLRPVSASTTMNWPLTIGCGVFVVSIALTELKERV